MRALLSNQAIRIDNHNRNKNNSVDWDDKIHIHKTMEDNSQILLYINKNDVSFDENVEFRGRAKNSSDIQIHLKNEIKAAFEDVNTRRNFINDFNNDLARFNPNAKPEEISDILDKNIDNICCYFNLRPKTMIEIKKIANKLYQTELIDNNNKVYIVEQDFERKEIVIGESNMMNSRSR